MPRYFSTLLSGFCILFTFQSYGQFLIDKDRLLVNNLDKQSFSISYSFYIFEEGDKAISYDQLNNLIFNDTLRTSYTTRVRSIWKARQGKIWVRCAIKNRSERNLNLTWHTGNLEYGNFISAKSAKPVGYLRDIFHSPEIPLFIESGKTDTFYLSVENYLVPQSNIRTYISPVESIEGAKRFFRENQYSWWFIFQLGFSSICFFWILITITYWWLVRRKEFIYYAFYLFLGIILSLSLLIETWALSFTIVVHLKDPMFLFFYTKVIFIIYSFVYFNFFMNYLDISKNDPELNQYAFIIKFLQICITLVEIILLFTTANGMQKLHFFACMGLGLNAFGIGFNFILQRKKQELLRRKEVKVMNLVASLVNIVAIPIIAYEIISGHSLIGPAGFFFFQFAFLIDIFFFNWTSIQKTLRIQREKFKVEKKQLETEKAVLEKENELQAFKEELREDFHDWMGKTIIKITTTSKHVATICKQVNIINDIKSINQMASKTDKEYRQFLDLSNQKTWDLKSLIIKMREFINELFENKDIEVIYDFSNFSENYFINKIHYKHLLFFMRESVTNIFKHADASTVNISLVFDERDGSFFLNIRDDGKGFDHHAEHKPKGYGLQSLSKRAEKIGAIFDLKSIYGSGTTISLKGILEKFE